MRSLEEIEQLLAVLGQLRLGRQHLQNVEHDVHGRREHREKLVARPIADDLIVNVHQGVQLLRLEQVAQKSEFFVGGWQLFRLLQRRQKARER